MKDLTYIVLDKDQKFHCICNDLEGAHKMAEELDWYKVIETQIPYKSFTNYIDTIKEYTTMIAKELVSTEKNKCGREGCTNVVRNEYNKYCSYGCYEKDLKPKIVL